MYWYVLLSYYASQQDHQSLAGYNLMHDATTLLHATERIVLWGKSTCLTLHLLTKVQYAASKT